MEFSLEKFRDRLRISILLFVFSEPFSKVQEDGACAEFRTEIKLQALDFFLRYPDFLSYELLDLAKNNSGVDKSEVKKIVAEIFSAQEPDLRVEEMEKFFHGAYESLDDVILYLVSVDFLRYDSKRRVDGKEYEKIYRLTKYGKEKIETSLKSAPSIKWYFDRCGLIKKYFGSFSGTELKRRQYRHVEEYAEIPYKSKIKRLHNKVEQAFLETFKDNLV